MSTRACVVQTRSVAPTVRLCCPNILPPPFFCTLNIRELHFELRSLEFKEIEIHICSHTPKHAHTHTHPPTHSPCRCIPTIIVRGTLLRKCCVCICSECVYSPERVIYFRNLPLSSSQHNGTLSISEHNSPGCRGTRPRSSARLCGFLPLISRVSHTKLPLVLAIC